MRQTPDQDGYDAVIFPGLIPNTWAVSGRADLQEGFRFIMTLAGAQGTGADSLGDTGKPRAMDPGAPPDPGPRGAWTDVGMRSWPEPTLGSSAQCFA